MKNTKKILIVFAIFSINLCFYGSVHSDNNGMTLQQGTKRTDMMIRKLKAFSRESLNPSSMRMVRGAFGSNSNEDYTIYGISELVDTLIRVLYTYPVQDYKSDEEVKILEKFTDRINRIKIIYFSEPHATGTALTIGGYIEGMLSNVKMEKDSKAEAIEILLYDIEDLAAFSSEYAKRIYRDAMRILYLKRMQMKAPPIPTPSEEPIEEPVIEEYETKPGKIKEVGGPSRASIFGSVFSGQYK